MIKALYIDFLNKKDTPESLNNFKCLKKTLNANNIKELDLVVIGNDETKDYFKTDTISFKKSLNIIFDYTKDDCIYTSAINDLLLHLVAFIEDNQKDGHYDCIFISTNKISKYLQARISIYLKMQAFSDVIDVDFKDCISFKRGIYTNLLKLNIKSKDPLILSFIPQKIKDESVSLSPFSFDKKVMIATPLKEEKDVTLVTHEIISNTSLQNAKKVIVLGQGCKSKEYCQKISQMAHELGYEIAATRPVVLNAFVSMDRLVGVSGIKLNADTVIVLGASGSSAFYYGIENCKKIIAVNTDLNASIMEKSDISIKADAMEFMQRLYNKVMLCK